jgi:FAD/FMN-containing dehydrogenase
MDPRQLKIDRELKPLLQGEVRTDPIALALFSSAACIFRRKPLAVVSPKSEEDVARTVAFAAAEGIPVTARWARASFSISRRS